MHRFYKKYTLDTFKESCNKKKCLRNTFYNDKRCPTTSKQENCFRLYNNKLERDLIKSQEQMDPVWEETKKQVIEQTGNGCHLLACLSPMELDSILQEGLLKHKELGLVDGAHILPRGAHPQHKYNSDNIILIKRLFHTRLEQYQDPLTAQYIGKEATQEWYLRVWNSSRKKNLTWEEFVGMIEHGSEQR